MFMGGVEAAHRLLRRHADKECNLINCSNEISHPQSSTQRWGLAQNCGAIAYAPPLLLQEDGIYRHSAESLTFDSLAGGGCPSCQGLFSGWKLTGGGISAAAGIPSERAVCGTAMFGGRIWAWL